MLRGDEPGYGRNRHGAAPDAADEGLRVLFGDVDDGLQARDAGRAALAEAEQRAAARSGDSGRHFHRRRHGQSGLNGDRWDMFNPSSYTTYDNISISLCQLYATKGV